MDKAYAIFLALLGFIGIIFVLTFPSWLEKKAIRRQSNWSSTDGTVTFSENVFKEGRPSSDTGVAINFVVTKVRFSYKIGDKLYSGEQEWTDSGLSRKEIPKAEKYPTGTKVIVYYNTDNPTEAVIERTIGASEGQGCLNHFFAAAFILSEALFLIGMIFLITKC